MHISVTVNGFSFSRVFPHLKQINILIYKRPFSNFVSVDFKMILEKYIWAIELSGFLVLIFIVQGLLKRFFNKIKEQNHLKETDLLCCIEHATIGPVSTLLWLCFAAFLLDLLSRHLDLQAQIPNLIPMRNAVIIGCLTWFFLRWKTVFLHAAASRHTIVKSTVKPGSLAIIEKTLTIVILFTSLLLILQVFGLNIVPLLAFGSIGAAALGFASKELIANFYGGLMLYTTSPFTINDIIELPQKDILGTVEEIGWYFTTIRSQATKPIYIPNALFSTEYLINQSRMTHRRIEETIGLRFEDIGKMEKIIESIRHLLNTHPDIDKNQPIYTHLSAFGNFSINLEIKAYTFATGYNAFMAVKQAILLKIYILIENSEAKIPYPITEVINRSCNV